MLTNNKGISPKEGIKFINEIIKEVGEETKFSEKEVKEAWRIHKKYLEKLMDDPEVTSIKLPHLGNFYFNANTSRAIVKWSKDKKKEYIKTLKEKEKKVRDEVIKHKKDSTDKGYITIFKYPQTRLGTIYRLCMVVYLFLGKPFRSSYRTTKQMSEIIEDYSNNRL